MRRSVDSVGPMCNKDNAASGIFCPHATLLKEPHPRITHVSCFRGCADHAISV